MVFAIPDLWNHQIICWELAGRVELQTEAAVRLAFM